MEDFAGISSLDFDVDSEYKPEPLIPNGVYYGSVTSFSFDSEKNCLVWGIALNGNDGFASDGETLIDGMTVFYRNWLPKSGDENEYSANGKVTKRQSKINMLKRFMNDMKIDIGTPQKLAEAISNQEFIGKEVKVTVNISEYNGQVRNDVSKMISA